MNQPRPSTPRGVDVFLFGVSKAASTWIYRCLKEHPGVFVPESDSLKFFDLQYHLGIESYEANFAAAAPGQLVVDASPTYFRSPVAAARVARHYPDARFVLSLRDPVERAFSQYWHEKKQGRMQYGFRDCLDHFMLFPWIVEHGFYASHMENLLRHVPRQNVTVVLYEDLKASPRAFLDQVLRGMGLPTEFEPSVLNTKINAASAKVTGGMKAVRAVRGNPLLRPVRKALKRFVTNRSITSAIGDIVSDKAEYDQGVPDDVRQRLQAIYRPEMDRLEQLLDLDLAAWKR